MKDRQQRSGRPGAHNPKKDEQKPQAGNEPPASVGGRKRIALAVGIASLVAAAAFLYFYKGSPQGVASDGTKQVSIAGSDDGYIQAGVCADCHQDVWETYQRTGMGRAFAPMRPDTVDPAFAGDNTFYHKAS